MSNFWSDPSSTSILHNSEGSGADLPEPSLVACVISTIISWTGSNTETFEFNIHYISISIIWGQWEGDYNVILLDSNLNPLTRSQEPYLSVCPYQWQSLLESINMSRNMTKPTKWLCAQRRLRSAWASAQSDQSSLYVQWVAKDLSFLYPESRDTDQTGRMPRLIWFFAGHTCHLFGFVIW